MNQHVFLIRHCEAIGQEPDAYLTDEGFQQARILADRLAHLQIKRIVSSPFRRAVESLGPLSQQLGVPIELESRLTERILSVAPLPNWKERLRDSFDDLRLRFDGGETSLEAMQRGISIIDEIFQVPTQTCTAVVSHGCLITLILKYFDSRYGFGQWANMRNPDVYVLTRDGSKVEVSSFLT